MYDLVNGTWRQTRRHDNLRHCALLQAYNWLMGIVPVGILGEGWATRKLQTQRPIPIGETDSMKYVIVCGQARSKSGAPAQECDRWSC
jgi:hypothetical protein